MKKHENIQIAYQQSTDFYSATLFSLPCCLIFLPGLLQQPSLQIPSAPVDFSPAQHLESNFSNAKWIISYFEWNLGYKPSDSVFGLPCPFSLGQLPYLPCQNNHHFPKVLMPSLLISALLLFSTTPWGEHQCSAWPPSWPLLRGTTLPAPSPPIRSRETLSFLEADWGRGGGHKGGRKRVTDMQQMLTNEIQNIT